VEIRNEVAGVVTEIGFESGDHVEEGALLLALDSDIERSALAAAKARRNLARSEMSRAQVLAGQGAAAPARVDEVRASFEVARREVASLEAQLEKKTLRAPFAGRVGIRDVAIGQYLDAGSRITVLDAVGEVFVDFSLPQEEMAQAQNGTPVRVSLRARRGETLDGRIVAVEPTVDPVTRNLGFRAHVPDPEQRLRPGMFVDVSIVLPEKQEVVAVPATAIVHAAYGDSVFVVEEKDPDSPGMNETPQGQKVYIAKQQFVRVGVALFRAGDPARAAVGRARRALPVVFWSEADRKRRDGPPPGAQQRRADVFGPGAHPSGPSPGKAAVKVVPRAAGSRASGECGVTGPPDLPARARPTGGAGRGGTTRPPR